MAFSKRVFNWIDNLTISKLIIIGYLVNLFISILFGYVLFPEQKDNPNDLPDNIYFIASILVAPFLETWLVQYTIMEYGYKWTKKYWPGLLVSIILFSVLHHYSIAYMLKTLFSGTVYSSIYFICMLRKWNGFLWTSLVHMFYNLTALIVNYFIDGK